MSDSLSTSQGSLSLDQNRSGSVAVASCGVTAGRARENSFGQFQSLLGSRETTRTRHCCVGGRHDHHTSARPRGVGKEFTFGLSDSVVRCFTGHRGLEQELGTEIFDRDHLISGDNVARPRPGGVLALAGNLLMQPSRLLFRSPVAPRTCLSRCGFTPSHPALIFGELFRRFAREHGWLKVVFGFAFRGDGGHTPVDTDRTVRVRPGLFVAFDNEAGVPVPERITVNPHGGRLGRQLTVPDDRQRRALHVQAPILYSEPADCEPVTGIPDRGQVTFGFEGPLSLAAKRVQGLLLHVLRPGRQPIQSLACSGQIFSADQPATSVVTRRHQLVPQPTRAVPLGVEHSNSGYARAQPVVVTQHLSHRHTPNPGRVSSHLSGLGPGCICPGSVLIAPDSCAIEGSSALPEQRIRARAIRTGDWRHTLASRSDNRRKQHMDTTTSRRPSLPIAKATGISGGFR